MYRNIKLILLVILIAMPTTTSLAGEILWGSPSSSGGGGTASTTTFAPVSGNTATDVQNAIANIQSTKADTSSQAAVLVSGQGSPAITTTLNPNDLNNDNTINDTLPCTSTTCFFQGSDGSMWHKTRTSGNNQWSRLDSHYSRTILMSVSDSAEKAAYTDDALCLFPSNPFLSPSVGYQSCTISSTQASFSFNRDTVITQLRFWNNSQVGGGLPPGVRGCDLGFAPLSNGVVAAGRTVSLPSFNGDASVGPILGTIDPPMYFAAGDYFIKMKNGSSCQAGANCLCNATFGKGGLEFDGYEIQ